MLAHPSFGVTKTYIAQRARASSRRRPSRGSPRASSSRTARSPRTRRGCSSAAPRGERQPRRADPALRPQPHRAADDGRGRAPGDRARAAAVRAAAPGNPRRSGRMRDLTKVELGRRCSTISRGPERSGDRRPTSRRGPARDPTRQSARPGRVAGTRAGPRRRRRAARRQRRPRPARARRRCAARRRLAGAPALAVDYGAGRAGRRRRPSRRSSSSPCRRTSRPTVVARELAAHPDAVVTDVASVKVAPLARARERGRRPRRGTSARIRWPAASAAAPIAARADLFVGRPWVVCRDGRAPTARPSRSWRRSPSTSARRPIEMAADEHDARRRARLARAAARRQPARRAARRRAGRGRSRSPGRACATRPASPAATPSCGCRSSAPTRRAVVDDARRLPRRPRPRARRARRHRRRRVPPRTRRGRSPRGNDGVARLPGKHGQDRRYAAIVVMVDDTPGELGAAARRDRRARASTSRTCASSTRRARRSASPRSPCCREVRSAPSTI